MDLTASPSSTPADDVPVLAALPLQCLAEWVTDRLDERAGPHALTDVERWVQRCCRHRFGIFSPTDRRQTAFIDRLNHLAAQVSAA